MERDELVAYCLAKPGAEETYPWGEAELVAKVGGKGFAFIGLEGGTVEREVRPGRRRGRRVAATAIPARSPMSHYVGRYGWNSVDWTGAVPDDEVRELVDASYDAAVAALPKSRRPAAG